MAERHPRLYILDVNSPTDFSAYPGHFYPCFIEMESAKIPSVATSLISSRQAAYQYNTSAGSPASSLSHSLSLSSFPMFRASWCRHNRFRVAIDFVVGFFLYSNHSLTPTYPPRFVRSLPNTEPPCRMCRGFRNYRIPTFMIHRRHPVMQTQSQEHVILGFGRSKAVKHSPYDLQSVSMSSGGTSPPSARPLQAFLNL